jgi:hypothetical protein
MPVHIHHIEKVLKFGSTSIGEGGGAMRTLNTLQIGM